MQWLIDLIIETIGIPPVYIHRGDPAEWDFVIGDLTIDDAWHELDLSTIVPEKAKAVHLEILIEGTIVDKAIRFRHTDQAHDINRSFNKIMIANVSSFYDIVQALDSNRKIDYYVTSVGWTFIYICIRGWWF